MRRQGDRHAIEAGGLIVFLAIVTAAFLAVVANFAGALLWAALAAVLFQPIFHRLLAKMPGRPNLASALTLLIITIAIVVPMIIVGSLVVDQAASVYNQVQSGQINFGRYFQQMHDALPTRLQSLVDSSGLDTFDSVQKRISGALGLSVGLLAGQALSVGRNAASFLLAFGVGLYVAFFLLRDGEQIGRTLVRALPLAPAVAERLASKFVAVVRATIKGSGVVALVQGALGAITFWIVGLPAFLLWGMLMAIAALLPAVGPALIWAPVALYLLATGAIWQAVAVILSGVLVIGLVDNILRPILVGRDTGIPDWLVLVTTLGGISLVGLSGIVIGPLVGALFLTAWQILMEQRERVTDQDRVLADGPRHDDELEATQAPGPATL